MKMKSNCIKSILLLLVLGTQGSWSFDMANTLVALKDWALPFDEKSEVKKLFRIAENPQLVNADRIHGLLEFSRVQLSAWDDSAPYETKCTLHFLIGAPLVLASGLMEGNSSAFRADVKNILTAAVNGPDALFYCVSPLWGVASDEVGPERIRARLMLVKSYIGSYAYLYYFREFGGASDLQAITEFKKKTKFPAPAFGDQVEQYISKRAAGDPNPSSDVNPFTMFRYFRDTEVYLREMKAYP